MRRHSGHSGLWSLRHTGLTITTNCQPKVRVNYFYNTCTLGYFFFIFSDINECTRGIDSCDKTSSYCTDTDGNFWCRCKTGYNQGANNKLCVGMLFYIIHLMLGPEGNSSLCFPESLDVSRDEVDHGQKLLDGIHQDIV